MPNDRPAPPGRLITSLTRRDLLGFAAKGAAGVVVSQSLLGCAADEVTSTPAAAGSADVAAAATCVLTAALTEGPYFVDEKLQRADIRADPSNGSVVAGVPLSLRFNVTRVADGACTPLTGAYLDVWHANPSGQYSDIAAGGGTNPPSGPGMPPGGTPPGGPPPGGTPPGAPPDSVPAPAPPGDGNPGTGTSGQKFLRGYQITDANGAAQFLTVYPGWYQGRAVHIHFKLRLFAGATTTYEFTSQFFFDEALTTSVHARAPYNTRGTRDTLNTVDGIYNSLSAAEKAALTLTATRGVSGYAGVINLGVQVG